MRAFYDELADDYHLMFRDWDGSMEYQGAVLSRLIDAQLDTRPDTRLDTKADAQLGAQLGSGPKQVLDCSCGIGTQAIGLARHDSAYAVTGTDLSPRAAARAQREAAARGVPLATAAADMRALPFRDATFDVVISADNSVTHLLTPEAVGEALTQMRRVLRPGGLLILTIRDYDELLLRRPASMPPQVSEHESGRAVTFQLWQWHSDGEHYDLEHFQLAPTAADAWDVRVRRATHWALTRAQLAGFVAAAGFAETQWHQPSESGFYQPVLTARR